MNLFGILMLPFMSALASILLRRWPRAQETVAVLLSVITFGLAAALFWHVDQTLATGYVVQQAGAWAAPFGISLVADRLSAVMLLISSFVGLVVAVYSLAPHLREWKSAEFYPLFHFLMGGVGGAFLTGDFFNLFVFFEVLLVASFAMMVQGRAPGQLEGAVKYTLLSLLGSMFFLAGLGFIYNGLGTLNMADVGRGLQAGEWPVTALLGFVLMMFAFAAKAGLFPLYFWLPSSYPKTPLVSTALFAALLTKVGVYALVRLFAVAGPSLPEGFKVLILFISLLTMLVGVLSAAAKMEIRSILSFHIISQIGYITLGLAFMTKAALTGVVFYLIHHIVVKANLFLVTGVIERHFGSTQLKAIGGLIRQGWGLPILFLVPAFSLAGLPPLSGFWAKFFVLKASLEAESFLALGVGLVVSLYTLYSMSKIWIEAFWKDETDIPVRPLTVRETWPMKLAMSGFVVWTLLMGFGLPWSYGIAERTAAQLLDSKAYFEKVLGAPGRAE